MTTLRASFASELVKLAERDLNTGVNHPRARSYLASMLIGGLSAPLLAIVGSKISKIFRNHAVMNAAREADTPMIRDSIMKELHTGRLFGHHIPGATAAKQPLLTVGDAAGDIARGAVAGSFVQMIRDRFSHPTPRSRTP